MQDYHPYSEVDDDCEIHDFVKVYDPAYEEFEKAWLKKSLNCSFNEVDFECLEAYKEKIGVDEKYYGFKFS